jgi:hypothetical protein
MLTLKTIVFYRSNRLILIKLRTDHPWDKKIKNCPNKGPGSRKNVRKSQKCKNGAEIIEKNSPREPLRQNSSDLHESFLI